MSKAKHTPGPWVFGNTTEDKRLILGGESRDYIATIQIHQTPRRMGLWEEPTREANARLIAQSPNMYDALKTIINLPDNIACPTVKNLAKEAIKNQGGQRCIKSITFIFQNE